MLRTRRALTLLGTALVAGSLMLSGCGRTAVNPLAPGDEETQSAGPGEEEEGEFPGAEPFPLPGGGGTGGGLISPSKPATGGGTAPAKPATGAKPAGGLRPLPKVTPIPPAKGGSGGGVDEDAEREKFVDLLKNFGYAPGQHDVQNTRMQVAIFHRVPATGRLSWGANEAAVRAIYDRASKTFPYPIGYEDWKRQGGEIAAREDGFTYYVARRELYRHILFDRYKDKGSDAELIFYKRLNRSNLYVTYQSNGQIDDFCYFESNDYRSFLPVPAAFLP